MKKRVTKILRQVAQQKTEFGSESDVKKLYKKLKKSWKKNTATKK